MEKEKEFPSPSPPPPRPLSDPANHPDPLPPPRRPPFTAIGAFTVQCASCYKWRLIPTKDKYEEIREHILRCPFYCEAAREWRPGVSCDDPADIHQDGSRLWAIDKPSIAQPPPGWQRLLRIRGQGSTKFADVYYVAPTGKTLRSMVEVQKYLMEHPEFMGEGVSLERFSFQTPRPLEDNYVRKRSRVNAGDNFRLLEPGEVKSLTWIADTDAGLRLGTAALPGSASTDATVANDFVPPAKKQAKISPRKVYNEDPVITQSEGGRTDPL